MLALVNASFLRSYAISLSISLSLPLALACSLIVGDKKALEAKFTQCSRRTFFCMKVKW